MAIGQVAIHDTHSEAIGDARHALQAPDHGDDIHLARRTLRFGALGPPNNTIGPAIYSIFFLIF